MVCNFSRGGSANVYRLCKHYSCLCARAAGKAERRWRCARQKWRGQGMQGEPAGRSRE